MFPEEKMRRKNIVEIMAMLQHLRAGASNNQIKQELYNYPQKVDHERRPMFGIRVKRIHFFTHLRCQELLAWLKGRRFHLHIQKIIAKSLNVFCEIRAESSNHCLRNMKPFLS